MPAGYAALIDAFGLKVPWPRTLSATGERHRVVEEAGWRILTPRHAPPPTLEGHLTFALKYEGLDLAVLKRVFHAAGPHAIEAIVRATPNGGYARRLWSLYEWLSGDTLDLPNADRGAIEGERPPQDRIQRWGRAIGEAGRRPLDLEELLRLQRIVIGDARFVRLGLRAEGGFVGGHDRETRMPLPDPVSARPEDLPSLVAGMTAFGTVFGTPSGTSFGQGQGSARELDPVIAAAVLAFGFVYAHPFEDGNGRIHRYLVHDVLARRGFNPPGVAFPVSAAILDRIDEYRRVLEDYSVRLLPAVEWKPTENGNVRVLNDTGDFYRFFDATPHAEFLYACVRKTIEKDLPNETGFLRRYDAFRARVNAMIDMPDGTIDLLFRFLRQNEGRLSRQARAREFAALTKEEAARIEDAYAETFGEG